MLKPTYEGVMRLPCSLGHTSTLFVTQLYVVPRSRPIQYGPPILFGLSFEPAPRGTEARMPLLLLLLLFVEVVVVVVDDKRPQGNESDAAALDGSTGNGSTGGCLQSLFDR